MCNYAYACATAHVNKHVVVGDWRMSEYIKPLCDLGQCFDQDATLYRLFAAEYQCVRHTTFCPNDHEIECRVMWLFCCQTHKNSEVLMKHQVPCLVHSWSCTCGTYCLRHTSHSQHKTTLINIVQRSTMGDMG